MNLHLRGHIFFVRSECPTRNHPCSRKKKKRPCSEKKIVAVSFETCMYDMFCKRKHNMPSEPQLSGLLHCETFVEVKFTEIASLTISGTPHLVSRLDFWFEWHVLLHCDWPCKVS